jgi:tripartite-type tricarboxylate transporter receptor subunit TctC
VPTLREAGIDVAVDIAIDAYGSGGIPSSAVTRMNGALIAAIGNPDVLQRILAYGLLPAPSSAEELAQKQIAETKLWAEPIKASGFTGE